jgi:transposase
MAARWAVTLRWSSTNAGIAKTHPKVWRAYFLKEALRYVFAVRGEEGKEALRRWLIWARRSQLPVEIVALTVGESSGFFQRA